MKTLIFLREDLICPCGGPYAVGYYINEERKRCGDIDICFLPPNKEDIEKHEKRHNISKKMSRRLYRFLDSLRRIKHRIKFLKGKIYGPKYDLNQYDIIHFNEAKDLYLQRENLKDYKGIVLYTSHSPIPSYLESIVGLPKLEIKLFKKKYLKSEMVDKFAFERADYVTFPCDFAEEPYLDMWEFFKEYKKNNPQKFRHILTGIPQCSFKRSYSEIRKEIGFNDDDFVVSYVGRHNTTKGYDNLLKIGQSMEQDNVKFLICGRQEPLSGLNKPYWHEVGWTNDPHSYINASDVFVLPNKATYFDIVMLEVLSLGKIVVASRTGGNKQFEKMNAKGIFLYDTLEEARELILKVKSMSSDERSKLEEENKKLFLNNFTIDTYYQNYRKLLQSIYLDFQKH